MPRLIVVVDCDFVGYAPFSRGACSYDHQLTYNAVLDAVNLISCQCDGKAAFLIHTSPYMRRNWGDLFFTSTDYLGVWKQAVVRGGELGICLHEEEPDGSCLYYGYGAHLEKTLIEHVRILERAGMALTCQSTGHFCMNEWLIPALESADIHVNFDNIGEFNRISGIDWSTAPTGAYFMSKSDVTSEGDSQVLSVPLGGVGPCRGEDGLMVATSGSRYLRSLWNAMCAASGSEDVFYMLVKASRIDVDKNKLCSILRFVRSGGARFVLPSDVYTEQILKANRSCEGQKCEF
jgi:hypothetical protein